MQNIIKSLFFILIPMFISAQESTVFGIIRDAISKNPVEIVTVYIEGTTKAVETNNKGYYKLSVPANKEINLIFSRIGYKKANYFIKSLRDGENHQINATLVPEDSKYEITITGSRIEDVGMIREDIEDLKLLPITSGNFESVLPSIALGTSTGTGGELSSQYNVRGGNYDENLVYVNDFEVFRPQLIQNSEQEGLSFPNSDLIKDLSFSSGGFEAKYGNKMSSVLDIHYKRPTIHKGSVSLSLLGGQGHYEGSKQLGKNKWNKLRVLTGIRYKDNRYLLNSQNKKGEYIPTFLDYQAFITYNITKDLQIAYLGNYNTNIFRLTPESQREVTGTVRTHIAFNTYFEGHEIDQFKNGLNGLSFTYVPERDKNPYYLKLLASSYIGLESQKYDIIGQYRLSQIETNLGSDNAGKEIQLLGIGTQHHYTRDFLYSNIFTIKQLGGIEINDFSENESSHFIQYGINFRRMSFFDKINEWERLDSVDYSIPYTDSIVSLQYVLKSKNNLTKDRYNLFVSDTYFRETENLETKATFGVRVMYRPISNEITYSPRAQFSFKPLKWKRDFAFKLAGGIYYQPPHYKEHLIPDGTLNPGIKSQKSIHILGGLSYDFYWKRISNKKMKLIAELYHKQLSNLVSYDYDNVRILYSGKNDSRGYITGLDFRLNGEFVPGAESWINVSIMQAKEKLDGIQHKKWKDTLLVNTNYVPRPTDRLVNVSLFFQDYLKNNKNFKVHFNLNVGTGVPFGFKDDNKIVRNNFRYPPYRRVDVGFSYLIWDKTMKKRKRLHPFRFTRSTWVSLEVFNLLGISNPSSVNWVRTITGGYYAIKNTLTSRRINLRFKMEI